MEIYTSRLLLREFIDNDLDDLYAFESDPLVVRYVCYGPYSLEECRQQLAYHVSHQKAEPRKYFHLGITLEEGKRLIGWCGLEMTSWENQEAEIGYALHREYWGYGIMTEAAQAILEVGFEKLRLHRIFAMCHPENVRSVGVLERLQMRYEGHLRKQKRCRNKWRDTIIYALLEDEWKLNKVHANYKDELV